MLGPDYCLLTIFGPDYYVYTPYLVLITMLHAIFGPDYCLLTIVGPDYYVYTPYLVLITIFTHHIWS